MSRGAAVVGRITRQRYLREPTKLERWLKCK